MWHTLSALIYLRIDLHSLRCSSPHLTHPAVSAYVTHGVFPNYSWQKFKHDAGEGAKPGCFRYFWITDSCPAAEDVANREPFEVLSLAAPIAAALQI